MLWPEGEGHIPQRYSKDIIARHWISELCGQGCLVPGSIIDIFVS